jgi:hypothetical protein
VEVPRFFLKSTLRLTSRPRKFLSASDQEYRDMPTRGDKIFAIGMTLVLIVGFFAIIFGAFGFWNDIPGSLDRDAVVPMILGILGTLILASIVIGIFLHGRRDEIRRDRTTSGHH